MAILVNYRSKKSVFVNYYPETVSSVRGGGVYTAMLKKHMEKKDVSVFNATWRPDGWMPLQLRKYLTFPYRRLAKLGRFELAHFPGPFNPGCLTFSKKVITTFHDQVNYDFYTRPTLGQRLLRQLEALTAAKTDYVITPSQFSAERTLARFPKFSEKIHVVNPGIDDVFFERRSKDECDRILNKLSLLPKSPFLLYVGAISPHKNSWSVIEAYAKLRDKYPSMKLVMIGSIRARREFSSLVKNLAERGIALSADVIIPHQSLSTLELSALYQSASVFLFPSLYEGWGIAVGEALASGTPTVISNIPVFRECFEDAALMVDPFSIDEMVCSVEALLSQPELRSQLRQKGFRLMRNKTWERAAIETIRVYEKCLP